MTGIPSTFDGNSIQICGNRSDHITDPLNPMTDRVPLPDLLQHHRLVSVREDLHTGVSSRGPDVRLGGPAVAAQPFAIKRDLKGKNVDGGGSFMMTHPPSQVWDAPPRSPLPPWGTATVLLSPFLLLPLYFDRRLIFYFFLQLMALRRERAGMPAFPLSHGCLW